MLRTKGSVFMDISNNAKKARPSSTLSISSNANRMIDEGIDIVNFSAGEPDFNTPDYIKEAAIEALSEGSCYSC